MNIARGKTHPGHCIDVIYQFTFWNTVDNIVTCTARFFTKSLLYIWPSDGATNFTGQCQIETKNHDKKVDDGDDDVDDSRRVR